MKVTLFAVAAILVTATTAPAQYTGYRSYNGYGAGLNPNSVYHQGYTTHSGTYVAPHYQSIPNGTQYDNWGTRGNTNPYTGQAGTRIPRY